MDERAGATTTAVNPTMDGRDWGMLFLLTTVWSGTFFLNAIALGAYPAPTVVAGRLIPAALLLLVLVRLAGQSMPVRLKDLGAYLVMGALNGAIPFGLIVWGQTRIASGLAAILNAATPLFTVLLAHFLTDNERLTVRRLGGVAIGVVGVALVVGLDAWASLSGDTLGQLAVLGAALSYALASIWGRRFRSGPSAVAAAGQVSAAALLVLPVWLGLDRPWTLAVNGGALLALAGVSVFGTAIAYLIYFRILKTAGSTNLMLVTLLMPFGAVSLGAAFLGERVGVHALAGMALIVLGLVTIDGRLFSALRRRLGRAAI
jgi:drug/metabolite transporter (DMT)-like permease